MSYFKEEYEGHKGGGVPLFLLMVVCAIVGAIIALGIAQAIGWGHNTATDVPQVTDAVQSPQDTTVVLPEKNQLIPHIATTVGPAVVGISNIASMNSYFQGMQDVEQGTGSGVIFSQDGYIVTNYHVIEGATKLIVSLEDGRELEATVVGSDMRTDLAVIKITADNLTVAQFGDSDKLVIGELVVAIGNPGGADFARSVTDGIVSGVDRKLVTAEGLQFTLIQTNAAINPGNSGGALVNSEGELIGINSIKISSTGYEGMGFAIPINTVKSITDALIANGKVQRPALGVSILQEVSKPLAEYNNLAVDYGVIVNPQQGGPAAQGGMQAYDIIIAIDGKKVTTVYELQDIIFSHQKGDTVTATVVRGTENLEIKVVLGELAN